MRHDRTWFASVALAAIVFVALSGLVFIIAGGIAQKDRLQSRNDVERTLSLLLAGLRDHRDFGETIETSPTLLHKVKGIGAYAGDGTRLYDWGDVPATYVPAVNEPEHAYREIPRDDTVALVLSPFLGGPPPPPHDHGRDDQPSPAEAAKNDESASSYFFFTTLRNAETIYLKVSQPAYWRSRRAAAALVPLVEAVIAALVLFVRLLMVRNAEYRGRLDAQRNLVVLGTAASTLAHEIKNPLLSIRLQTRILQKTCPDSALRELDIINEEVERLSALSHRVGDYLRDPAGSPVAVDPADTAVEVGQRLCGRTILRPTDIALPRVLIDPERLRSVLENLVRNALESGGPEDAVEMTMHATDDAVCIEILDRGKGIAAADIPRVFDPFFTTKSRGTGIGLAISKRFIEAVGGTIALQPRAGGGCVARITLPGTEART